MLTLKARRARRGFTLIELVVVVLVMGILAAVAAPKMFDTATNAKASATRQSLAVVRDAIELYKAQVGTYPGQGGSGAALANDLKTYIKGPFPKATVPGVAGEGTVKYETNGNGVAAADGSTNWIYDTLDGTFVINAATYDAY